MRNLSCAIQDSILHPICLRLDTVAAFVPVVVTNLARLELIVGTEVAEAVVLGLRMLRVGFLWPGERSEGYGGRFSQSHRDPRR